MHKYKNSASPYLCEVDIDPGLSYTKADLSVFISKSERGVAVYGHTPNVLIVARGNYKYWDTLSMLVGALDTGKVAICGRNFPRGYSAYLQSSNSTVKVRLLGCSESAEGKEWLRC